jgi:3',5'-cyclic AMP phosphodiesterase CpdA
MRFFSLLLLLAASLLAQPQPSPFYAKPYLQLGDRPAANSGDLSLLWLAKDQNLNWKVELRQGSGWKAKPVETLRRVAVPGAEPHRVMQAALSGLKPNRQFDYRVKVGNNVVFASSAMSRKDNTASSRIVLFGDCAAGTAGQKAVAHFSHQQKPDMVFITGDIVYSRGRVSEYEKLFWDVYNADQSSPSQGAPLLRNSLFMSAIGNHDVAPLVNLETMPDSLAYYYYWDQPRNGPPLALGGPNTPTLQGSPEQIEAVRAAAQSTYPRMANYSFDYGNAHITVLDANPYVDWTSPGLRAWLKADLAAAQGAPWRIVMLHHPPFNSSKAHANYQRMRVVSDLLEEGNVSIVFAGHVHNYQRTYPLKFQVEAGFVLGKEQAVPGEWTLDKSYDGVTNTKPDGVLYIVTGAGGAGLYNQEQTQQPETWKPFTAKFISDTHSFTVLDMTAAKLTVRQISAQGEELDKFTVEK